MNGLDAAKMLGGAIVGGVAVYLYMRNKGCDATTGTNYNAPVVASTPIPSLSSVAADKGPVSTQQFYVGERDTSIGMNRPDLTRPRMVTRTVNT